MSRRLRKIHRCCSAALRNATSDGVRLVEPAGSVSPSAATAPASALGPIIDVNAGVDSVAPPGFPDRRAIALPPRRSIGLIRAAFLLVGPVIIAAMAAFAGASRMELIYAAQSEVVFDLGERGEIGEQYLATQAVVATSRAVLGPVSRSLGISIDSLQENLDVEFPKGSAVLRFQYSDPDGARAFDILRSVIDQYINLIDRTDVLNRARSLLVPPFVLEDPVWPKPFQAGALGAAAGLAIAIAALALVQQQRSRA